MKYSLNNVHRVGKFNAHTLGKVNKIGNGRITQGIIYKKTEKNLRYQKN